MTEELQIYHYHSSNTDSLPFPWYIFPISFMEKHVPDFCSMLSVILCNCPKNESVESFLPLGKYTAFLLELLEL